MDSPISTNTQVLCLGCSWQSVVKQKSRPGPKGVDFPAKEGRRSVPRLARDKCRISFKHSSTWFQTVDIGLNTALVVFLIGPWQASRFFGYLKLSVKLSDCVSLVYNSYLHAWGNFRACSEIWSNRSSMSAKVFTSPEIPVRCASPLASPLKQYGSSALTNRYGKVRSYIT